MTESFEYSIVRELHSGDGALLVAARRIPDGEPVCLKLLARECPTPREVARLRHEHAILQELPLEGVLQIRGIEVWEGGLALVLEAFDGQPLDEVARGRRLGTREALRIAASVAGALAEIHRRRVIHKDIRPGNVLVSAATGQVKLTGFGIASRLSREPQRAASPHLLEGSLAYMSPEQTGRMNRALDHRTDLYSLGVTLYELLTSAPPFAATDPVELVHSHIARAPAPPCALAPEVPAVVSEIVMKLLAKAAEDRYETARGLEADLRECLRRWGPGGELDPFPLGLRDRSEELRLPQKLYGREREIAALLSAFERAGGGGAELLLVAGASGVGKSALVHEIHKAAVRRRGGAFVAGKFEQLSTGAPYAPVMQPLRELCRRVLTEPADALARWKERLLGALGPGAPTLGEVLPELTWILGPQPRAPELGPVEAQARLRLAFQDLVRAFSAGERPLVLFLDDLQWADPGSLRLIQAVLTDPERAHLLVIGAYRDGEVGAGHPLSIALAQIRAAGAEGSTIRLAPLSPPEVAELIAEALRCERARAEPLAALVCARTDGNPLFVGQLLQALRDEGLLAFDAPSGAWTWDPAAIEASAITGSVVALMAQKIRRLAAPTQRLLELAACVGHEVDLGTLAVISEQSPAEAAAALWEALAEGLVLPLGADYRLVLAGAAAPGGGPAPELDVSFRFSHDRVQQAAYASIPEAQRQEVHLRIGRLMLARGAEVEGPDERLFDVVRHLTLGAARITDPVERLKLARISLEAGRRAKGRADHAAAAGYLEAGRSVLPAGAWEAAHELVFALHAEGAECAYLSGALEAAEALFEILLARGRSAVELARAHDVRLALYVTQGRIEGALRVGREALALVGIEVPEGEAARRAAADAELAAAGRALAGRRVRDLLDAPEIADEETRAALRLLMSLTMPAAFTSPSLYTFFIARQVNLSLERGHSDVSAYGYMAYGWIAARVLGRYKEAYEIGRLALDLNDRFENADLTCKLNFMFGAYISFFTRHFRSSLEHFRRAHDAGLRTGDLPYLSYTCVHTAIARIELGDECGAVLEEVERSLALMRRTQDELATTMLTGARQVLINLTGGTRGRETLDDGVFDEAAYEARLAGPGATTIALAYHALRQGLCVLYGDREGALRQTALGEAKIEGGVGHHFATELVFHACLALLAPARDSEPAREPARDAAALARHRGRLEAWAESCPDNYRHKHLLVLAEAARDAGEGLPAMRLYDQAIAGAREGGFVRDEALGSELCARFHLAGGRERIARAYLIDAYHAYLRWGATAKVEQLAERHPDLLAQIGPAAQPAGRPLHAGWGPPDAAGAGLTPQPVALDAVTVLRAAQAISGEILLDRLLGRLLRIVLESAGAQRGVLLLLRDGPLRVEATITLDPDAVRIGLRVPLEAAADLPASIVRFVERTREPVVLGGAAGDERFAGDPYVAAGAARSILCLAMLHQGRLVGVLYLEHRDAAGAFGPARLDLCQLLVTQAAIAVQNALLYEQVQRASAALEAEVARRTEELREANERLTSELASRERGEGERAALQEEIIRAQRDRLLELSAPLIPITDRITVLPLIGEVDPARAQQVLDTTLNAAAASQAAVVLIDVTGARRVDAGVATTLLQTAAALRLIGTQAVITGVRPKAARALVGLGIDLCGIVTRGTLQDGLEYALGQVGGDARWIARGR